VNTLLTVLVVVLLGAVILMALVNWLIVAANFRASRSGTGEYSSPLLGLPQIFAFVGAGLAYQAKFAWLSPIAFWVVAAVDVSVIGFVALPFISIWRRFRRRDQKAA
jgi:hypothetical protein